MEYFRAETLDAISVLYVSFEKEENREGNILFKWQSWPKSSQLQCEASWEVLPALAWVLCTEYIWSIGYGVLEHQNFHECIFLGFPNYKNTASVQKLTTFREGQWAMLGGGWRERSQLSLWIPTFEEDTTQRGLCTSSHLIFMTSLPREYFISIWKMRRLKF